jgi:hypothetical protein
MREVEWETVSRRTAQQNGSIGITTFGGSLDRWRSPLTLQGLTGYSIRAEAEEVFHANLNTLDMVAWSLNKSPSGKAGAVHFRVRFHTRGA